MSEKGTLSLLRKNSRKAYDPVVTPKKTPENIL
jgi:hypothetical protein